MESPESEQDFQALFGGQAAIVGAVRLFGLLMRAEFRNTQFHVNYFSAPRA
jgi:hypothetical protein